MKANGKNIILKIDVAARNRALETRDVALQGLVVSAGMEAQRDQVEDGKTIYFMSYDGFMIDAEHLLIKYDNVLYVE